MFFLKGLICFLLFSEIYGTTYYDYNEKVTSSICPLHATGCQSTYNDLPNQPTKYGFSEGESEPVSPSKMQTIIESREQAMFKQFDAEIEKERKTAVLKKKAELMKVVNEEKNLLVFYEVPENSAFRLKDIAKMYYGNEIFVQMLISYNSGLDAEEVLDSGVPIFLPSVLLCPNFLPSSCVEFSILTLQKTQPSLQIEYLENQVILPSTNELNRRMLLDWDDVGDFFDNMFEKAYIGLGHAATRLAAFWAEHWTTIIHELADFGIEVLQVVFMYHDSDWWNPSLSLKVHIESALDYKLYGCSIARGQDNYIKLDKKSVTKDEKVVVEQSNLRQEKSRITGMISCLANGSPNVELEQNIAFYWETTVNRPDYANKLCVKVSSDILATPEILHKLLASPTNCVGPAYFFPSKMRQYRIGNYTFEMSISDSRSSEAYIKILPNEAPYIPSFPGLTKLKGANGLFLDINAGIPILSNVGAEFEFARTSIADDIFFTTTEMPTPGGKNTTVYLGTLLEPTVPKYYSIGGILKDQTLKPLYLWRIVKTKTKYQFVNVINNVCLEIKNNALSLQPCSNSENSQLWEPITA